MQIKNIILSAFITLASVANNNIYSLEATSVTNIDCGEGNIEAILLELQGGKG